MENKNKNKIGAILMASIIAMAVAMVMPAAMGAPDIETLRPNAAGTYQAWATFGTGSHWDMTADELDTTGVEITGDTTSKETENLADPTFPDASTINSVTVYARCNCDGSAQPEDGAIIVRTHSTDYETEFDLVRNTWTSYSVGYTTNPSTLDVWTYAEVTALEVGSRAVQIGSGETMQCSEYWIVVDYTATGDTTPPGKVTGVTVTTVSSSELNVSWTANTEPDMDHYNVYRSEIPGIPDPSNLVASPTVNYYLDSGLKASTTYFYQVTAVDTSANEGTPSDEVYGTTEAESIPPDFIVGNLVGKVELFVSTDDGFSSRGILKDVGDRAWGITSGDFNGDDYRDFIVGDYEGELELFLGHGFASAGIIADVGDKAYGLTSGDYDNDGDVDFIVGDRDGELELFLNDGTGAGGYNSAGIIADIGMHAWGLTSCDFDGDSDVDFIAGNYDGTLKLFKNDGTGSFTSTTIENIGDEAYGVTSGDYDGDSDCDFLATAGDGEVKLFKNNGAGTFTNCGVVISLGSLGYGLESNDFDGDGDIDVLGENSTYKVNLYKNDGTGNFNFDSIAADPGTQPRGLTSGNFVLPDLIVTSMTTPIIHAGVSNVITATIENGGNENAGAFDTTLYADDVEIETKTVSSLNASANTDVCFSWTPTDAGPYTLRVMADSKKTTGEFNESNNNKTKAVTVEKAMLPATPNIIKYGYVFYEDGTACNGPVVTVENINTGNKWSAETYDTSNHYELILDSSDKSVGDVLRFTATDPDATQSNTTDYTVTQAELDEGGIFGLNLTLKTGGEEEVDDVTTEDMAVTGTVANDHTYTHTTNDEYEAITEIESGGKPANRYSYLEHKWTIGVPGGSKTKVTFYLEAHHTANSEGDDFEFAYSTDDSNYINMESCKVTKTTDDGTYQTYELPTDLSGTVYIRVLDTDQTAGNKALDTISIDHIFIRSVLGASEPDTTPPAAVTDLAASDPTSSSITLTWTAPGDDGSTGTAASYDIRYSTATITDANWGSATQCAGEPAPQPAGSSESFTVTGLNANTMYYFALKTSDEVPNESPLSNVASNTTSEAGGNQMHVASIDMSLKTAGPNVNAIALVTIVDATGTSVEGATVEGHWSDATTDADSGITDASGQVSVDSDKVNNPPGGTTFTFTVDTVSLTGWTYDSASNAETSDSIIVP